MLLYQGSVTSRKKNYPSRPVREALAMKGMKSRLLNFQNLFHSSDLNKDDADTIITAPKVADGI